MTDRWQYTCAPLNADDPVCNDHMFHYVSNYCDMEVVPYPADDMAELEKCAIPTDATAMSALSDRHMRLDLYLWFNTKHGDFFFPEIEKVTEARIICTQLIEAGLFQMTATNIGNVDGDKVPAVARPSWLKERQVQDIYAGVAAMPSKKSEQSAVEAVRAGVHKFVRSRAEQMASGQQDRSEFGDIVNSKFF
ncbi:hypothetical protein SARC_06908 [Sphaeroforma arctica JP610]|uniref:Uncharacterized protein n=1 Tax=Sphaeroforma arctica JP610 TaxID=667725 RepID=A0A0L0FV79_9EUKA|nr:hypothetical protein SARC_06908 [Sphaeroforma arctica JP610]KNC80737.1 hypothetical protein SARC_06908 [Sphaeroforma arctica JP610]|eukprot:XP_014154639.1 hypothetical protein SARC_06908 [Sphaeroforma arctica JP610]